MDARATLALFDEQLRRRPEPQPPDGIVEETEHVVRFISEWWTGVVWSDLDVTNADAVIAAQLARFTGLPRSWEWKHYSYDEPADLPQRLVAAGFTPEPDEALLAIDIADLDLDVAPPAGVELRAVTDAAGIDALVRVAEQVFGQEHAALRGLMRDALEHDPSPIEGVVAIAGDVPIAGARLEFHPASGFASFWGDGTLPAWRGRGVYRALVAFRAARAAARGCDAIWVEASSESEPILRRLGFLELARTTPYVHPGG